MEGATLKAARLHGPLDVRIEEVPVPEPAPGEVLLRVRAVAICASDCRMYWDGHAGGVIPEVPISQGHEFAGDVVALGEGVRHPAIGTRVAVDPSWHCGKCDMCRRGYTNICRHIVFPSFPPRDGALAEYIACPAHATYPLPDSVSYIAGALAEPLGVGIHAVRLANAQPEHTLTILGAGAIGVCTLLYARWQGIEQIKVVEPITGRRDYVRRLGVEGVGSYQTLLEAGFEADLVFECAGEGAAIEQALHLAKPAGKVIVVGIPHPERISFEANIPRRRELTLIFSRRSRNTLEEAISLVASGQIDLTSLPIRIFTLAETAAAIEATASRPPDMLRAVVIP
ncbi:MAG: zinc-dependent alcohol dehydrogenase [Candidatus Zipacnadales bacterium]